MPEYEVCHVCPLSESQQEQLAEAITVIHSTTFSTPRLFVNVKFSNISQVPLYVAGKRRSNNRVLANVRHGPTRTQEQYESIIRKIMAAWEKIVPESKQKRSANGVDYELRMVILFGAIVAAFEAGFMVPEAGKDQNWLQDYAPQFQAKADEGDEDFKEMLRECKERGLLK
ncbi:hypothetical protein ANO11243_066020 [Dothideomycetidae sp. 11243]|nr:hypothetical protein ANO11243_066020 [fungal sp. No.11243]